MKVFFIAILSIFTSLNSFASVSDYVACRAAGSDEYDIALEFTDNKLAGVSTLESDFKIYSKVEAGSKVSVIYLMEYDTNFGYDLSTNSSLQKIQLTTWISGNDSDNYYGTPTQTTIECHLLKSKPVNSILVGENVQAYIPVEKL